MSEMEGSSLRSLDTVDPTSSVPMEPLTKEPLEPNLEPALEPCLDTPDLIDPDALESTEGLEELKDLWLKILGLAPPGHLLARKGPEPLVEGREPQSDGRDITSSLACTIAGAVVFCHTTLPPHLTHPP